MSWLGLSGFLRLRVTSPFLGSVVMEEMVCRLLLAVRRKREVLGMELESGLQPQ